MQTDRRHELETNDLADSAAALAERVSPHLRTIGLAAVALVLGFAAWSLVGARREAAREESWTAFMAAAEDPRPEALDLMADYHQGTPAARWARVVMADRLLGRGSQALFVDREQARQLLEGAADRYKSVLDASPPPAVAERATLGLAKARENLGSLDEARKGYEALVTSYPASPLKPFAEERFAALGRESTKQWYDWFVQQKPTPPPTADGAAATSESPSGAAAVEPAAPGSEPARAGEPAAAGTGTDAAR